jgi:hypothetical protein
MVKKPRKKKFHWSIDKKTQAVIAYLTLGKMPLVEAATGIPAGTVHQWKQQEWWGEMVNQIRREDNVITDSRLSKILDKTMSVIEDRLENGDWMYDPKSGKMVRKPVGMRDAVTVAESGWNRRDIIRSISGEKQASASGIEDQLKKVAEAFEKFAKSQQTAGAENESTTTGSGEQPTPQTAG